jgi:hypothetical protein
MLRHVAKFREVAIFENLDPSGNAAAKIFCSAVKLTQLYTARKTLRTFRNAHSGVTYHRTHTTGAEMAMWRKRFGHT